jgi:HD-like signal output (HDOD) protein
MENFSHATARAEPLPADTMAAVQLLDLFRDPDRDIDRIVEFINNDPALTAETLKRCNNGWFRGSERVNDIFEAVSRLGFYELYDIIAASIEPRTSAPDLRTTTELETIQARGDNLF